MPKPKHPLELLDTDTLESVVQAITYIADTPAALNDWLIYRSLDTRPAPADVLRAIAADFAEVVSHNRNAA